MFVPQARYYLDTIQTGVLRQSGRNHFHCVRERFPANCFGAREATRLRRESLRDGDLWGAAPRDESALFHKAADDTQSVMERPLGFVENQGVGTTADDGNSGTGGFVSYPGYFDGARARGLYFFKEFGGAEFIFSEGIDIGDWLTAG